MIGYARKKIYKLGYVLYSLYPGLASSIIEMMPVTIQLRLRNAAKHGRQSLIASRLPVFSSLGRNSLSAMHTDVVKNEQGVTLVGYVAGDFGVAENLRAVAGSLQDIHYAFDIYEIDAGNIHSKTNNCFNNMVTDFSLKSIQLYCVNADLLLDAQCNLGVDKVANTYRVGYWFWELANFPSDWMHAFDLVDEVWAPSKFIYERLSKVTTKPLIYIPVAVDFQIQGKYERSFFNLPKDKFIFLSSFDFHSFSARKNSKAAIEAFKQAFPLNNTSVGLIVKTINGEKHPEKYEELLDLIKGDARISILDKVLSRDEMYGLINVCDCYVSLHRSEGFGLGMAEAMLLAKPVIVTAYSGNMDFTNDETSCLVDYDLVAVQPGDYPCWQDQQWAEPKVNQAAEYMVKVYSDSIFRENMASKAQSLIKSQHAYHVVGKALETRLGEISALTGGV